MDGLRDSAEGGALPYGEDTIVLRITWPAARPRGLQGRMWRMRPLGAGRRVRVGEGLALTADLAEGSMRSDASGLNSGNEEAMARPVQTTSIHSLSDALPEPVILGQAYAQVQLAVPFARFASPHIARGLGALLGAGAGIVLHNETTEGDPPSPDDKPASTPVGRRAVSAKVPRGTNKPARIDGRDYSGHALDRMQEQGVPPSAVEDAIKNGISTVGNRSDTLIHNGANNVRVITGQDGQVITVINKGR